MNQHSIIIIDDDEVYCEVLARSFSRLNHHAEYFVSPKDALPKIKSENNLVILLDLKLNSDSGLKWINIIRAENLTSKIILVTGYASISTAVEAIKLGADDYLTKPITAREILEHLQNKPDGSNTPISEKPMSVERLEWEHIQKVLSDHHGNISASARALNMHRRTLQRKLLKKPVRQ